MADQKMRSSPELLALRPELWSSVFYSTLLAAHPFNSVVARTYEGDIKALGNQVNITQFPEFDEAEDILEGQKVDAEAITASNIPLVINHQVVKDYIVTDKALIQTIDSQNALRDLAINSIMKKMQRIIIDDTIPSGATPDHTLAYDTGTTLALVDILNAKELLDNANVPDDGSRCMILDSPQWNDIFNITGLTSRDFVGDGAQPLVSAALPARVLGFNPKMTTEANAVSFFFHPSYLQLAVQRGMDTRVFDEGVVGSRAQRVNSTVLFGDVQASDVRVVTVS